MRLWWTSSHSRVRMCVCLCVSVNILHTFKFNLQLRADFLDVCVQKEVVKLRVSERVCNTFNYHVNVYKTKQAGNCRQQTRPGDATWRTGRNITLSFF